MFALESYFALGSVYNFDGWRVYMSNYLKS